MALLIKRNNKERGYYRLEWRVATFVCLKTVTSCLYAHEHLLKCWKARLSFNCKQVGDIYCIKTHGSVSCGPRSRSATPVSILTGRTKTSFSHLCISVIAYPIGTKFATQLPASQGSPLSKFEGNRSGHFRDTSCQSFVFFSCFFFFFVFSHTCKHCYNKQTRTPIAMKFGTQKGSPTANPSIQFGANPMNGSGGVTDYSRKTRSICCHAYRVNRFME